MTETEQIKNYLVTQFVPDLSPDDLADDYDLIAGGVIDSLALLRVITWLASQFDIDVDQVEIAERHFVSVEAIREFVASARTQTLAA